MEEGLLNNFNKDKIIQKTIPELEKSVVSGEILPANAARKLLEMRQSIKK